MIIVHSFNSPKKDTGLCDIYSDHLLPIPIIHESLSYYWIVIALFSYEVDYAFMTVVIVSSFFAFKCTFVSFSMLFLVLYKVLSLRGFHVVVVLSSFVSRFFILLCIFVVITYAHVLVDLGIYWKSFTFSFLDFRLKMLFKLRTVVITNKLVCSLLLVRNIFLLIYNPSCTEIIYHIY